MAEKQLIENQRGSEAEPHIENTAPRLIGFLSTLLERLAESNDGHRDPTAFHGVTMPAISIRSYLERIFRYANCSESCFLVAYVYLDRLAQRHPVIGALDSLNIHRLLITSVLIAAKFMDDIFSGDSRWSGVGGSVTRGGLKVELRRLVVLQQCILCKNRRDKHKRDELPRSRVSVRFRVSIERDSINVS